MKKITKLLFDTLIGLTFAACNNNADFVGNYKFSGTATTVVTYVGETPQQMDQTVNGSFTISMSGSNSVVFAGNITGQGTIKDNAIVIEPTHAEQTMAGMKQTSDVSVEPILLGGSSLHIVCHSVSTQGMDGEVVQTMTVEEDYVAVKL